MSTNLSKDVPTNICLRFEGSPAVCFSCFQMFLQTQEQNQYFVLCASGLRPCLRTHSLRPNFLPPGGLFCFKHIQIEPITSLTVGPEPLWFIYLRSSSATDRTPWPWTCPRPLYLFTPSFCTGRLIQPHEITGSKCSSSFLSDLFQNHVLFTFNVKTLSVTSLSPLLWHTINIMLHILVQSIKRSK